MRRRSIVFVFGLFAATLIDVGSAAAQFAPREREGEAAERAELETDRDAFTPSTSTVGRRLAVFETSYSFIDNRTVAETHSLPETLLRYGVNDWFELRAGWNYEVGGTGDIVSGSEGGEGNEAGGIERESQLLYGAKISLTDQRGFIPRSALILQGYTPTSGTAPATDVVVAYAFGWELRNKWRLESSLRYGTEHAEHDEFNQWAPSVIMRVPLTERWNVHAEYFGIYSQGSEREFSRAFFSPGTHYLLTENLELGVRVGWGLTNDAPNFFSNIGLGWRF
jgi:hypothetical protein